MKIKNILIALCIPLTIFILPQKTQALLSLPWDNDTSQSAYRIDTTNITPNYTESCSTHENPKGKIDFGLKVGTNIVSVDSGKVDTFNNTCQVCTSGDSACLNCGGRWGRYIRIKHGSNKYSTYAHLKKVAQDIELGDSVSKGELIAISGNTGGVYPTPTKENPNAGEHLHFEWWNGCSSQECLSNPGFYEATTQVHANEAGRLVCGTYKSQNSSCTPPNEGTWIVSESCKFTGSATAPENILVKNNSILTITNDSELDIDFIKHNLSVEKGSTVLVEVGGKIF